MTEQQTSLRKQPAWWGYAVAVLAVVAMAGLRAAMTPILGDGYAFITFFFAVLISAVYGGLWPGLLSILLSALLATYFFIEPIHSLIPANFADGFALSFYALVCIPFVLMAETLRRSREDLSINLAELASEAEGRRRSEARTRAILENALDANVSMNMQGIVTGWNASAERMFGWTAAEVTGKPLSTLIIPLEYRAAHETGLERFKKTGKGQIIDKRLRLSAMRKDGVEFPVELTVSALEGDEEVSFNGFIRDITIENALQEAQERLSTTLRSIGDAVIATDAAAKVTFMNHVAEELTGWSQAEALGKPATEVFRIINEQSREPVEPPYDRVLREGVIVGLANHTVLVSRDGIERGIEDSGAPIRDAQGDIMGVVLVFHDVSDRRRSEENRSFLARATEIMGSSLDYKETLATVAQLATPKIADWCAIDMLDDDGELQRLATAHVDPEKVRYVLEIGERYPSDREAEYGTYNIVRTGEAEMLAVIPKELLEAAAKDEEHLRIIRELDLRSYMGVPIKLRDKVLGVIAFVSAESGRTYTEDDLAFAEQLASRAAVAVDNARLFTQLKQELEDREVRERQQATVADLGHRALAGASIDALMEEAVKAVAAIMGTDLASVAQMFPQTEEALIVAGFGWPGEVIGQERFSAVPGSQMYFVAYAGGPITYEDLPNETRFTPLPALLEQEVWGGVGCRIEGQHGPWGTIQTHTHEHRRFSKQDASFLQAVANVLATAIERRRTEEALGKLAAIVESSADAIVSYDLRGNVTNWNPGAEALFGYSEAEAMGLSTDLIVPGESRADVSEKLERLRRGQQVENYETVRRRKDGSSVDVSVGVAPIKNAAGDVVGISVISRDITERRLAAEALQSMNVDLERRVHERTAELQAANTELEAFSYSVSHDLRAPLRALDGFSRILVEDYGKELDGEAQDYLNRIRLASQRMAQLIEDLLNLAYVTRTEMRREDVDLSGMLQTIADELNTRQPERPVAFDVAPGMTVNADPRLLRAAMENLMQNAWKFSSRVAEPRVSAGSSDGCYFIRDNGAGFDQTFANKLFQPFQRLHSATDFPGTGIGLATVQRIIQRHGGTVRAEGQVGKGATIWFTL